MEESKDEVVVRRIAMHRRDSSSDPENEEAEMMARSWHASSSDSLDSDDFKSCE
jgi:hypothetical protein